MRARVSLMRTESRPNPRHAVISLLNCLRSVISIESSRSEFSSQITSESVRASILEPERLASAWPGLEEASFQVLPSFDEIQ
jgi:hypothetical protein